MRYLLTPCTVYTGTDVLPNHAVLLNDGRIEAVLPATAELPADVPRRDGRGLNLAPGFVDLQIYGGASGLFSVEPTPTVLADLRAHTLRHGTTSFLPCLPTSPPALMREALATVQAALPSMPGLLGLHLEGPYINPVKKGAHQEAFIQTPTLADIEELLNEAGGALRFMTLAPERVSPAVVARLRTAGVVLSAGHSAATYEQATAAFDQDFTTTTHLFNAMSGFESRAPGLVGAVYDHPAAHASIIADGVHCAYAAVRVSQKMMGERLFLITDAVTASSTGAYRFHQQDNYFVDEKGTLAGSALTMLLAVRNCVQHVGLPLAEALRMASLYPARVVGLAHEIGRIEPGYRADLCLFDDDFQAHATILRGEWYAA
ncbi:N-acetylglucosamine-6-phosphate deacetylase [Hymenobacter ginsengisoli]|uniref:N-acetylglucosamine-6-phosphate deacetylase n=1 Tax=Hymenobacter ginsengisoli TaxID=1051626 RepID=A0ABP8QNE6_9BACT|nr:MULTISPECIES: N-acetylglucosamine-6-phosphate deacetylase [unclassified Hymenobacter]MBO2032773.1 N-acetylglucosamine-6-phosphate deacetylase [Hymenobacter sp. BT559]